MSQMKMEDASVSSPPIIEDNIETHSTTPGIIKEEPLFGRNTSTTETDLEPEIEQMSREELAEALRITRVPNFPLPVKCMNYY